MLTSAPVPSAAVLLLVAFVAVASQPACGGTPEPKAENYACFRALDCQAGLVCVEGRCTADLTPIVPEASGAPPAPRPPALTADAGPDDE